MGSEGLPLLSPPTRSAVEAGGLSTFHPLVSLLRAELKSDKMDEGSCSKAGSESKKAESEGTGEEGDPLDDEEEEQVRATITSLQC